MSHDGLTVNHAGLDGAATDLLATVRSMNATLDNLGADIKSDVLSWTGAEGGQRAAYDAAKATWDLAIRELRDLLEVTATTTSEANADYRSADLRGAARFGG
jgi:6 kDa early secretory antigenic target